MGFMTEERYSISRVARCFGLRVSALRYYDQLGLLRPVGRRGTVRYYGRAELNRLALIQCLHRDGLVNLVDTAALLADEPAAEHPAGRQLLADSVRAVSQRIRDLENARRLLEHLLSCPTADPVRDCTQLRDRLDQEVDAALAEPVDAVR